MKIDISSSAAKFYSVLESGNIQRAHHLISKIENVAVSHLLKEIFPQEMYQEMWASQKLRPPHKMSAMVDSLSKAFAADSSAAVGRNLEFILFECEKSRGTQEEQKKFLRELFTTPSILCDKRTPLEIFEHQANNNQLCNVFFKVMGDHADKLHDLFPERVSNKYKDYQMDPSKYAEYGRM